MSLKNLNSVFLQAKQSCSAIGARIDYSVSAAFKVAYSDLVANNTAFSRHDRATWIANETLALHSRSNRTITYIPSVFFYIARELVPLYRELCAYRNTLLSVLADANRTLEDVEEPQCVPYIQKCKSLTEDEKEFLCKFVTDGSWWGKGRQIKRAQDFYESPLMQGSGLTQETQSEVARIARQLSDHEQLLAVLEENSCWFEDDFKRWYLEVRCKGPNRTETNSTIRHYSTGLNAISAEQGEKDSQKWCGIYEYLLGCKPKPVFSIGAINEFEEQYGLFSGVFAPENTSNLPEEKYQECYRYVKGSRDAPYLTDHGNLSAAFNAYRDFLVWRENHASHVIDYDALVNAGSHFWTYSPGTQASAWKDVQKDGVIALSYKEVGDFSKLGNKDAIVAAFRAVAGDEASHKNGATAVVDFRDVMKPGDIVFAKKGMSTYIGVGKVTGEFYYDEAKPDYPNRRKINWFKVETHELSDAKAALKTLTDVTSYPDFVKKLLEAFGLAENAPERPISANTLTTALKLFQSFRYGEAWQKNVIRDSYLNIYEFAKPSAEDLAAMSVEEFKTDIMSKVWAFQNGGARTWGQLDDDEKAAYQKFVAEMRGGLKPFETYFPTGKQCPRGMGVGVVSELLMRFYPTCCCSYNEDLIWDALVALGLCEGDFNEPKRASVYQDFMGKCATILRQMEEMKFGRTPKEGDKDPPDYITVNEFFWFVHDYKDLIKEEVMKTEFKMPERKRIVSNKRLSTAMKDDPILLRLAAALRTKPFAILAGHSGTGKSRMVRRLAYMTCFDEGLMAEAEKNNAPGNYCMIQVRPNWHDSTDLLGYYSEIGKKFRTTDFVRFVMKAYAYPEIPFFVCLDEMNLAPVEQYFAEYLSAIESANKNEEGAFLTDPLLPKGYDVDEVADNESCRFINSKEWYEEHGLTIPKNLFVVGTVNMDDTTCQFSRKVLDRAMTIMMDQVKFEDMMDGRKSAGPSKDDLVSVDDIEEFLEGKLRADPLTPHQVPLLNGLKDVLGKTPFAVAYRFANEYALYEASLKALTGKEDDENLAKEAMDHCVLMKVLPRIHGTDKEVKMIFCGKEDGSVKGLESILDKETTLSGKKMEEILARKTGYLSFWP